MRFCASSKSMSHSSVQLSLISISLRRILNAICIHGTAFIQFLGSRLVLPPAGIRGVKMGFISAALQTTGIVAGLMYFAGMHIQIFLSYNSSKL